MPASKEALAALLERVEAATGPDRELDHDLLMATSAGAFLRANGYVRVGDIYETETPPVVGTNKCCGPEPYTASIDASVELVNEMLPVADWECLTARHRKGYVARVWYDTVYLGDASTAPLAILSALFRALIAQAPTQNVSTIDNAREDR